MQGIGTAGGSGHAISTGQGGGRGKLVIPTAFRREMGVKPGDTINMELDEGEFRVRSLMAAIRRVQARMRELNPGGRSLVEELIAERRAKAARQ